MRHQGRWAEAERVVRSACEALQACGVNADAGTAFNELGELELRRGNLSAAETAFQRANEFGCDPVPGLPLLRLAQGNVDAAARMIERALSEPSRDPLHRASLLVARLVVDLASDRLESAAHAADELMAIAEAFDSPMYRGHAHMGRGGVALARGETSAATTELRESWGLFRDAGFPLEAARARVLLGEAYSKTGDADDARMQFEAARKAFSDLGAKPDLDAVSVRLADSPGE